MVIIAHLFLRLFCLETLTVSQPDSLWDTSEFKIVIQQNLSWKTAQ